MDNHLITPFIMREAGIMVNDTPKIQLVDPDVTSHSIYFAESDLRIPLSLWEYYHTYPPLSHLLRC